MRPLSATTAASSSVSKQPRKRQVLGRPACSAGIMRWTAHLLSKTDHETPVNLKGRWQACQVLRNTTHGQITCSINTRYKMHAVQNACGTKLHGSMLLTWAKNLLAAAAHDSWLVLKAHLNPKCINHNPKYSSPGALTCLCCLHGLLALLLNKFTKISRLPYLFFVVRKIWKVDRV